MAYRLALWGDELGTRVPFSDLPFSLTFPIEQFWGRAARASWIRKNPDARFIFHENLPLVPPLPLRSRQDVPFHRTLQVALAGARSQRQFGTQGIQFEKIAMRFARWWTGTVVAGLAEIVAALARSIRQLFFLFHTAGQRTRAARDVVNYPMHPGASGCIRVISNQCESLRARWSVAPFERRRTVFTLAGEGSRDVRAIGEIRTVQGEGHGGRSFRMILRLACG